MDKDIEIIRENIKKNLTLLRITNKLKMREVAAALGIKENTYRTWEDLKTVSLPKADKLIALSEIYNVSVDFLMKNEKQNILNSDNSALVANERIYGDRYLNELSDYEKVTVMKIRMLNVRDREKLDEYLSSLGIPSAETDNNE